MRLHPVVYAVLASWAVAAVLAYLFVLAARLLGAL